MDRPSHAQDSGFVVAKIVHELANVSNGLNLHGELLRLRLEHGEIEAARQAILDVSRESERLVRLIEGLRRIERIEGVMEPSPWSPVTLLSRAIERVMAEARAAGVHVSVLACDEDLPAVTGDLEALTEVLHELVRNAAQAGAGSVSVSLAGNGDEVRAQVVDDGEGIAEYLRPRLFSMFSSTRKPQGQLGLGLWRARTICERLGADLDLFESEPGRTCFELRLAAATTSR